MGTMLETWWWPLRAGGWGVWQYDFRHARNGLVLLELQQSAAAAAIGRADGPVCHLYAGLFAAVFSHLAHRPLAGLELQCAAAGADRCRFVVATDRRIQQAAPWRDERLPVDEIVQRLSTAAT
jgi:predicted hydrocarbon binding protein